VSYKPDAIHDADTQPSSSNHEGKNMKTRMTINNKKPFPFRLSNLDKASCVFKKAE